MLSWDYTAHAAHYEQRAPYHVDSIEWMQRLRAPNAGRVVDIGAGTGRLARMLVAAGYRVDAVEPNAAMRAVGVSLDRAPGIRWHASRGEATGLPTGAIDLVSFGSSFNVIDAALALDESARLLRPGGAVVLLWNHRVLDDPLQAMIEATIRSMLPGFVPGSRRQDPSPLLRAHPAFGEPRAAALESIHETTVAAFVDGFRAHATLARQAGELLPQVLEGIATLLRGRKSIAVPFITRIWVASRAG